MNLKVLPLHCYDIILGIDWLEQHSPMEVHWKLKWLSFEHLGSKVQLFGLKPNLTQCPVISALEILQLQAVDNLWCIMEVFQLADHAIVSSWPEDIHHIIEQYQDLFAKPVGPPPKR
jgi:hypothetical protein